MQDIGKSVMEFADAGGLPTIALGLMDAQALARLFAQGHLTSMFGGFEHPEGLKQIAPVSVESSGSAAEGEDLMERLIQIIMDATGFNRDEIQPDMDLRKDLWITDHRPFKFIKHPIVSATMVLETFMEAARILYPHLQVQGVRKVRLMDMIEFFVPGIIAMAVMTASLFGTVNVNAELLQKGVIRKLSTTPITRMCIQKYMHIPGQIW